MHKNNIHNKDYNFSLLCEKHPQLKEYVFTNKHNNETINFAYPNAVKALNTALLKVHYNIDYWQFSDESLCPPIPGRVDYIHHLKELLTSTNTKKGKILDIGTGATCIYPILGNSVYNWEFIASDIDENSLYNAQKIIDKNNLKNEISLRHQKEKENILFGILNSDDKLAATMCNPPFYSSEKEAQNANARKMKGLGIDSDVRNFSGNQNELWYKGGEKAFLHNYLYQSSKFKENCTWFTSLVSKKENVESMTKSLKKLNATTIKIIPMAQGNKATRIVAWSFKHKA